MESEKFEGNDESQEEKIEKNTLNDSGIENSFITDINAVKIVENDEDIEKETKDGSNSLNVGAKSSDKSEENEIAVVEKDELEKLKEKVELEDNSEKILISLEKSTQSSEVNVKMPENHSMEVCQQTEEIIQNSVKKDENSKCDMTVEETNPEIREQNNDLEIMDSSNNCQDSSEIYICAEIITSQSENISNENCINPAPSISEEAIFIPPILQTVPKRIPLGNTSLGLLASLYDSDASNEFSDSDDCIEQVELNTPVGQSKEYRNRIIEIDSDSSSSDSDVEIVNRTNETTKIIDIDMLDDEEESGKARGPIRVKGELLLDDLPPIQDLQITVPEYECVELGKIHSIVDQLVLIDALPGTLTLDLDTVLFLDKGKKVLGEVFDVLGQVTNPLYCVRFNSNKQIKEKGIEIGQTVYVAPRSEHTQFVILPDLLKIRGSDASWDNDIEPSERNLDYSDDEQERVARRNNRNHERPEEEDPVKKQRTTSTSESTSSQNRSRPQQRQLHTRRDSYNRCNSNSSRHSNSSSYYPENNQTPNNHQNGPQHFNYNGGSGSWHSNYNQNVNFAPPYGFNQQNYNQRPPFNQYPNANPQWNFGPQQGNINPYGGNFNQPPLYPQNAYQSGQFVAPDAMQQVLFPSPPPPPGM